MADTLSPTLRMADGPRGPKPVRRFSRRNIFLYGTLIMVAIYYLIPLYVMVVTSVKGMPEIRMGNIFAPPMEITFQPWVKAWAEACTGLNCDGLSRGFWNSVTITVPSVIVSILIGRFLVTSKFGKVLIAIRDAESRARFLGYRVENYKLAVFTLSAMMAGVAGALYVPQVGIINPSEFSPAQSIEAVIWVAVGGRGTLVGAALGALIVNFAKTWFTGALPEYWLFALGLLFVLVTLFLPRGVLGLIDNLRRKQAASDVAENGAQPAAKASGG